MSQRSKDLYHTEIPMKHADAEEAINGHLGRPVAFYAPLQRVGGGGVAGVFLAQLWYWSGRRKNHKNGWIYKNKEEWERETGLNYREQLRARRELKKRGILQEVNGRRNEVLFRIWLPRLVNLVTGAEVYEEPVTDAKRKQLRNLTGKKRADAGAAGSSE